MASAGENSRSNSRSSFRRPPTDRFITFLIQKTIYVYHFMLIWKLCIFFSFSPYFFTLGLLDEGKSLNTLRTIIVYDSFLDSIRDNNFIKSALCRQL